MIKRILKRIRYLLYLVLSLVFLLMIVSCLMWFFKTPKMNANWEFGMQKTQQIIEEKHESYNSDENKFIIKDIRNYDWRKNGDEEKYEDMDFKLGDIEGLEVGVSHFSKEHENLAHVFLIFNLKDGRSPSLSIETRREGGEKFEFWKGMFFDYEIMYIWATKEDLLSLREKRDERIYVYPIKTTPERVQKIFLNAMKKTNKLYSNPEFYHIMFKNCTNQAVNLVKSVSTEKFPWYEQVFAPGYTGKALFEMELINTSESDFEKVREKFLIDFKKK